MDIARSTGLSKGSVSRALSMSEIDCPLNPETRTHILRVAEELGYRVNPHARALSSGKSMNVGLLYEGSLPIIENIYHDMVQAFAVAIRDAGYHLTFLPVDADGLWEDALIGGRVDGCVGFHSLAERVCRVTTRAGRPLVLVNGRSDRVSASVFADDRQGAKLATEHLLSLGHRRVLMCIDRSKQQPHYSIDDRRAGFEAAMQAAGLAQHAAWIDADSTGVITHLDHSPQPATAIICYSHIEAIPLLRELARSGRHVPRDVSVVAFNDVFPARELNPALTTITVPSGAIGREGARLLLNQLTLPRESQPTALALSEGLVGRESTGPCPPTRF